MRWDTGRRSIGTDRSCCCAGSIRTGEWVPKNRWTWRFPMRSSEPKQDQSSRWRGRWRPYPCGFAVACLGVHLSDASGAEARKVKAEFSEDFGPLVHALHDGEAEFVVLFAEASDVAHEAERATVALDADRGFRGRALDGFPRLRFVLDDAVAIDLHDSA